MTFSSPPASRAGVRPSVRYSPELGRRVCERLAAGMTQAAVAAEPGMPSASSMRDWARRHDAFAVAFEAARQTSQARALARDRRRNEARGWRRMLTRVGRRGGDVSMLTPELQEAVCARIASGETLMSIGADPAMPAASTISGWVRRYEDFREAYLTAKDMAADLLFGLAFEIAIESTEETVQSDRLRLQMLRWHTAMLAPKRYGERVRLGPLAREDDEGEAKPPLQVIIRRFCDPPVGPQFTDLAGNPVPRPEGYSCPLPPDEAFVPVPEGQVSVWDERRAPG